jgi:hypothetical protein
MREWIAQIIGGTAVLSIYSTRTVPVRISCQRQTANARLLADGGYGERKNMERWRDERDSWTATPNAKTYHLAETSNITSQ